jgi:hypothetical protein
MSGIYFVELLLKGFGKKDASIEFSKGINIISGPSNTGKTFIFECLEYMLGGSGLKRRITQSESYNEIFLEIGRYNGTPFTIKTDFESGDFHQYECPIDEITSVSKFKTLKREHSPGKQNTLSYSLLNECGLANHLVRTNANGKTRELSFRDIRVLHLIDEIRVLTQGSPLLTGQHVSKTVEENVARLLLTGNDDSGIIESIPDKVLANKAGRLEVLHELIGIEKINTHSEVSKSEIIEQETKLKLALLAAKKERDEALNEYNDLSNQKEFSLARKRKINQRQEELNKLYDNSFILEKQYYSDIKRLNSTIEAGCTLIEIENVDCPVCQTNISNTPVDTLNEITNSSKAELLKLEGLLNELTEVKLLFTVEIEALQIEEDDIGIDLYSIQSELDSDVKQKVSSLSNRMDEIHEKSKSISLILKSYEKLEYLDGQIAEIENLLNNAPPKKRSFDKVTTSMMQGLAEEMQGLLNSWGYPNVGSIAYSEDAKDFVISGEKRNLAGKGYRAITFASFVLAMNKIGTKNEKKLGLCLIDSPLVTYKKPDVSEGEAISEDMAGEFYRSLAGFEKDLQVIIIENEDVPKDIESSLNMIHFTKNSSVGRYGFIPIEDIETEPPVIAVAG